VVNDHGLREDCLRVGIARPIATHGEIQEEMEALIGHILLAAQWRWQVVPQRSICNPDFSIPVERDKA